MRGRIAEVFDSIQGEGLYLGERQLFVRFFGCNLKCKFCDTKLDRFAEYEPHELLEKLKQYQGEYHSVSFTGGEPLLQKDFLREVSMLTRKEGFMNYLDTNGTLPDELEAVIDYLDIVAMDFKLPSSTESEACWEVHRRFLKIASQKEVFIKTVICKTTNEKDLKASLKLIKEINKFAILVLQPNTKENHGKMARKLDKFRETCIQNDITTCVIPQVHKVVGIK